MPIHVLDLEQRWSKLDDALEILQAWLAERPGVRVLLEVREEEVIASVLGLPVSPLSQGLPGVGTVQCPMEAPGPAGRLQHALRDALYLFEHYEAGTTVVRLPLGKPANVNAEHERDQGIR